MTDPCEVCSSEPCECTAMVEVFRRGNVGKDLFKLAPTAGHAISLVSGLPLVKELISGVMSLRNSEGDFHKDMLPYYFCAMMEDVEKINERLRVLSDHLDEPIRAHDVNAILIAAERVSDRCSGAKKRQRLKAAIFNSFRPDFWDAGTNLIMLRDLEGLDYPHIRILDELSAHHAKFRGTSYEIPQRDLNLRFADNLVEKNFAFGSGSGTYFTITNWGKHFLRFITEEVVENGESDD